ncbi:MAG: hypothetical protein WBQ89_14170 [Candidatus Acidiferrum sp.]
MKFGEVRLIGVATSLWLPTEVKVYLILKEHGSKNGAIYEVSLRNQHHYSNYRHYGMSVKIGSP